jgi:hypothetical protein
MKNILKIGAGLLVGYWVLRQFEVHGGLFNARIGGVGAAGGLFDNVENGAYDVANYVSDLMGRGPDGILPPKSSFGNDYYWDIKDLVRLYVVDRLDDGDFESVEVGWEGNAVWSDWSSEEDISKQLFKNMFYYLGEKSGVDYYYSLGDICSEGSYKLAFELAKGQNLL